MRMEELKWQEHPGNPLICPPRWEFLIADPSFLTPEESPDGRWHLFAHGIMRGIYHYTSTDGEKWTVESVVVRGLRPFILKYGGRYYLYYESMRSLLRSTIRVIESVDLMNWSKPVELLAPSLPWEGKRARTNGNPCVVQAGEQFMLYYSAGISWLRDCGFPEPRHIGVAFGDSPTGPFEKRVEPILSPDAMVPHRNHGAGAIKVVFDMERKVFWGFTNGIYLDSEGHSRSDIRLMRSSDGVQFEYVNGEAIVSPGGEGWKKALVYALDVRRVGREWWMYFNSRDGWFRGKERIGLTRGRLELAEGQENR